MIAQTIIYIYIYTLTN